MDDYENFELDTKNREKLGSRYVTIKKQNFFHFWSLIVNEL